MTIEPTGKFKDEENETEKIVDPPEPVEKKIEDPRDEDIEDFEEVQKSYRAITRKIKNDKNENREL